MIAFLKLDYLTNYKALYKMLTLENVKQKLVHIPVVLLVFYLHHLLW